MWDHASDRKTGQTTVDVPDKLGILWISVHGPRELFCLYSSAHLYSITINHLPTKSLKKKDVFICQKYTIQDVSVTMAHT